MASRRILAVVHPSTAPVVRSHSYILYEQARSHRPVGFSPWEGREKTVYGATFEWRQTQNEEGDEFWIHSTDGQDQAMGATVEMLSMGFFSAGVEGLTPDRLLGVLHAASTHPGRPSQRFIDSVPRSLYGRVADLEHRPSLPVFDALHGFIGGAEKTKTFQELWDVVEGAVIPKDACDFLIYSP